MKHFLISATILLVTSVSLGAQVATTDLPNLSVALEDLLSREADHAESTLNERTAIAKQAATSENTRELLALYNKVGGWIKGGAEMTAILSGYLRSVDSMIDFSRTVAGLDYEDIPHLMYYLRYGWAYVVYIEDEIRRCRAYLNRSNDMTQEYRMTQIQTIARNIGRAEAGINGIISDCTVSYYNTLGMKRSWEILRDRDWADWYRKGR